MKLTSQQAKQAIEYFAAQAAEDAPEYDADKHMWMTRMQASLAIERQITEQDWDALVARMTELQSFDRDPEAYLHEYGFQPNSRNAFAMEYTIKDQVSWAIDLAYDNSGA